MIMIPDFPHSGHVGLPAPFVMSLFDSLFFDPIASFLSFTGRRGGEPRFCMLPEGPRKELPGLRRVVPDDKDGRSNQAMLLWATVGRAFFLRGRAMLRGVEPATTSDLITVLD
jgi:hypothetical protein